MNAMLHAELRRTIVKRLLWALARRREHYVIEVIQRLWKDQDGQDIAEYAVMLAVILVIVVGTVQLIGSNANNVFSQVGSQLTQ